MKDKNIKETEKLLTTRPEIVYMRNNIGCTLLVWSSVYSYPSMVELLISRRSDVWAKDKNDANAYHYAAANNNHEILKMLCTYDATKIYAVTVNNRTPVFLAAKYGHIESLNVLLSVLNVDTTIRDIDDNSPYDVSGTETNTRNRKKIRNILELHEITNKLGDE